MKHTTLLAAMAIAGGAMAQRPATIAGHAMHSPLTFSADRTPSDTLVPTSFADPNASLALYTLNGAPGYVVGTNQYDEGMAQTFMSTGTVHVEQLLYFFAAKDDAGQPTSIVQARVYGLDGAGTDESDASVTNAPGTVLGNVDMPMSSIDTSTATLMITVAQFNPAVQVTGNFAGGFEYGGLPTGSLLGLWSTSDGDNPATNQNWEDADGGAWIAMGNSTSGWGLHVDFGILAVLGDGVVGIHGVAAVNNMRMSFIGSNPASNSVIVAYDMLQDANARIMVLDAKGGKVVDQQLGRTVAGQHQTTLQVSDWADGTYYVTIFANGAPITKKLMVKH